MGRKLKNYVKNYDVCKKSKQSKYHFFNELTFIPVFNNPWPVIAIDFITDLPFSINFVTGSEYDYIMVIIDKFNKMCYYILRYKTMISKQFAILFS